MRNGIYLACAVFFGNLLLTLLYSVYLHVQYEMTSRQTYSEIQMGVLDLWSLYAITSVVTGTVFLVCLKVLIKSPIENYVMVALLSLEPASRIWTGR
jgi:uncharacterized membrane protein